LGLERRRCIATTNGGPYLTDACATSPTATPPEPTNSDVPLNVTVPQVTASSVTDTASASSPRRRVEAARTIVPAVVDAAANASVGRPDQIRTTVPVRDADAARPPGQRR
jgi:hypothetical protein